MFGLVPFAGKTLILLGLGIRFSIDLSCAAPLSSKFSITATDICRCKEGLRDICDEVELVEGFAL